MFRNQYLQRPLHDKRIITDTEDLQIGDIFRMKNYYGFEYICFKSPRSSKVSQHMTYNWYMFTKVERIPDSQVIGTGSNRLFDVIQSYGGGSCPISIRRTGYYCGSVEVSILFGAGSSQGSQTETVSTTVLSNCTEGLPYPAPFYSGSEHIPFYYTNGQTIGSIQSPSWSTGGNYREIRVLSPVYRLSDPVLFIP